MHGCALPFPSHAPFPIYSLFSLHFYLSIFFSFYSSYSSFSFFHSSSFSLFLLLILPYLLFVFPTHFLFLFFSPFPYLTCHYFFLIFRYGDQRHVRSRVSSRASEQSVLRPHRIPKGQNRNKLQILTSTSNVLRTMVLQDLTC